MARIGFDEHHMGTSVANPESEGLSMLADTLVGAGHQVERIEGVLELKKMQLEMVMLPFPKLPFEANELTALHDYISQGGGVMLLAEWGDLFDHVDHLNELTIPYGITIQKDRVTDLSDPVTHQIELGGVIIGEQATPHYVRITNFQDHPITEEVNEVIYFSGCSLLAKNPAQVLAATAESSFGDLDLDSELDDDEIQGSLPIAAAAEAGGRLVVVGDSNIAANGYVERGDNLKFVLQSIEWLIKQR